MLRSIYIFWKGYKNYLVAFALLIISLLFISLDSSPELSNVRKIAFTAFASASSLVSDFTDIFVKESEFNELREVNARLMLQTNQLREFGIENEELKKLLEYKKQPQYPLIQTKIISKTLSKTQNNFTINSGSVDGVEAGMPLINHEGLIGIVSLTADNFAIVRTLRNQDFKLAVKNQRSKVDGVMIWDGMKLIIQNVPKTADMQVGDRIVTSDFSTIMPPSIPIGIVAGGAQSKTGIFDNITIIPFVDFTKTEYAFVLKIVQSVEKKNLELNLLKGSK